MERAGRNARRVTYTTPATTPPRPRLLRQQERHNDGERDKEQDDDHVAPLELRHAAPPGTGKRGMEQYAFQRARQSSNSIRRIGLDNASTIVYNPINDPKVPGIGAPTVRWPTLPRRSLELLSSSGKASVS